MKCNITDTTVIGYLLQTLSPRGSVRMEKHLAACGDCRARLGRFRRARALLDGLEVPAPPKDLAKKAACGIAGRLDAGKAAQVPQAPPDVADKAYIEALGKTVASEQMRVYQFLTKQLGVKKGEAAFDEYLQEQMLLRFTTADGTVLSYEDVINIATGERSFHRMKDDAVESTVEHCYFPRLAQEMGVLNNPCETICRRQIKVVEKLKSVRIRCLRHRTHIGGGCAFLIKPARGHSS